MITIKINKNMILNDNKNDKILEMNISNNKSEKYTSAKRFFEKLFIFLFIISLTHNICLTYSYIKLIHSVTLNLCLIIISFFGIVLADFVGGIVHWLADTYGNINWPILGIFIISFREHHVKPSKITKYDWIGTNGDNCMVVFIISWIPYLSFLILENYLNYNLSNIFKSFIYCLWTFYSIFLSVTNQIHKASHQIKPHLFWKFLQDHKVILSKQEHKIHHNYPFDTNYTITTGWLNRPLNKINFWKKMEFLIYVMTGVEPRVDDIKWNKLYKE